MAFQGLGLTNTPTFGVDPTKKGINENEVKMLSLELIDSNPKNKYSIEDIKELALNIAINGRVEQPLIVYEKDGRYSITSGDRRFHALKYIQEHKLLNHDKLMLAPCFVRSFDNIAIPQLSDEQKEKWAIMSTNVNNRNMTQADMMQQAEDLLDIYNTLKDASDISEDYKQYFGDMSSKTKFLQSNLGVGKTTANALKNVSEKAIPVVKESVKKGELSVQEGDKISKLKKPEQVKVMNKIKQEKKEPPATTPIDGHNKNIMPPPQIGQPLPPNATTPKLAVPNQKITKSEVSKTIDNVKSDSAKDSQEKPEPIGSKFNEMIHSAEQLVKLLKEQKELKPSQTKIILDEEKKLKAMLQKVKNTI